MSPISRPASPTIPAQMPVALFISTTYSILSPLTSVLIPSAVARSDSNSATSLFKVARSTLLLDIIFLQFYSIEIDQFEFARIIFHDVANVYVEVRNRGAPDIVAE